MTMTITLKIVYSDTTKKLIINKSITKECAKEILLGAGILVAIMLAPKIYKKNNQNNILNVIFIQTV